MYTTKQPLQSQLSHTLMRLGKAYAKQTNHDDAIAAYKTALALNPSNITSFLQPEFGRQERSQTALDAHAAELCDGSYYYTTDH